jgi:hypothetical protein
MQKLILRAAKLRKKMYYLINRELFHRYMLIFGIYWLILQAKEECDAIYAEYQGTTAGSK